MKPKSFWQSPIDRVTGARWFRLAMTLLVVLILASFVSGPRAQLQQSGGGGSNSSVGSTGATAPSSATLDGGTFNTTLPSPASGQMVSLQLDSSGRLIVAPNTTAVSESGTWNVGLSAGTNLIGYSRPQNGCSTTNYESGMVFLPTASTSVTATSTCVTVIILNNTSSSAQTVSVQDQSTLCNSAACNALSSFSIPGNSELDIPLYGAKLNSGIKWNAGTANTVMGDIIGNQ